MKVADLERWKTKRPVGVEDRFLYEAGLGDFMLAYTRHLSVPRWLRGQRWQQVEKIMRNVLNNTKVRWDETSTRL